MPLRVAKEDIDANEKQLGLQALQDERWLEAASHLEKALAQDPTDTGTMNALALAHNALGDGKKARSILGRAMEIAPNFPATYQNLAVLLAHDRRVLEAADNACRAVELDPSNAGAVKILKEARDLVLSLPRTGKKGKKRRQVSRHTQADIDTHLKRINSVLRKAGSASSEETGAAVKPTISLCMVVRDEQAFLDDCLKSVKDIADEMVVVDTGSEDRTPEIAKAHGGTVKQFKWSDNYADARNEALQHAGSDWILVLDADERLDESSKGVILRAVSNPSSDAYELLFHNYSSDDSGSDIFIHRACRLYRNRPEYRYRGRVHERIVPSIIDSGGAVGRLDALIHHYGYRPEMTERRHKHERYIRMLHAELDDNPGDVYCLNHLGAAYSSEGNFEKALVHLEQAAERVSPDDGSAPEIFHRLANALVMTGKAEQALAATERAERMGIRHPGLSYCKGNALLLLGRYEEAIGEFQSAIRNGRSGDWLGDKSAFGYKADYGIASAYTALGDYERAVEFGQKVLGEKPDYPEVHRVLATAYFRLGQPAQSEKHLTELLRLEPDDTRAAIDLADLRFDQGRYAEAKERYSALLESGQETPELRLRMAACMHALGELRAAEEHYILAIRLNGNYVQAHTDLGRLYAQQDRLADALQCFATAAEIDPTYANAYLNAGDVLYSAGKYQDAANFYQSGLSNDPLNALGFLALGNCYFQMGAYEAAIMAFRQALAIRPDCFEAQNNLTMAEQALATLERRTLKKAA